MPAIDIKIYGRCQWEERAMSRQSLDKIVRPFEPQRSKAANRLSTFVRSSASSGKLRCRFGCIEWSTA